MPGVNPSNRRLRRANNLTEYGAASGGFGFGIPNGVGASYHAFRLFNRIKKECCKEVPPLIPGWKIFDTLTIAANDTEFGKMIAMSEDGNFLAVIAQDTPSQVQGEIRKGSVHIFKLGAHGYSEVSTHYPSANNMSIGASSFMSQIDISDDGHTVIYHELNTNTSTGSGVIIRKNANNDQFAQVHKLLSTNAGDESEVAISGDASRVAVASPEKKEIDIYKLNAGNQQYAKEGGTLENNNNDITKFGQSLSFNTDGSRLVVGTEEGPGLGGFYILGTTGAGGAWASVQEFLGTNAGHEFGKEVAISGNGECIVVSLPTKNQGAINVYKKNANANTFTLETSINSTAGVGNEFGMSLAISKDGSKIITSAKRYDAPLNNNGMVVVYKKDGNNYVVDDKILTGQTADERFGGDVAISKDGMIIAGSAPDFNNDKGYVRVFKFH